MIDFEGSFFLKISSVEFPVFRCTTLICRLYVIHNWCLAKTINKQANEEVTAAAAATAAATTTAATAAIMKQQ